MAPRRRSRAPVRTRFRSHRIDHAQAADPHAGGRLLLVQGERNGSAACALAICQCRRRVTRARRRRRRTLAPRPKRASAMSGPARPFPSRNGSRGRGLAPEPPRSPWTPCAPGCEGAAALRASAEPSDDWLSCGVSPAGLVCASGRQGSGGMIISLSCAPGPS